MYRLLVHQRMACHAWDARVRFLFSFFLKKISTINYLWIDYTYKWERQCGVMVPRYVFHSFCFYSSNCFGRTFFPNSLRRCHSCCTSFNINCKHPSYQKKGAGDWRLCAATMSLRRWSTDHRRVNWVSVVHEVCLRETIDAPHFNHRRILVTGKLRGVFNDSTLETFLSLTRIWLERYAL